MPTIKYEPEEAAGAGWGNLRGQEPQIHRFSVPELARLAEIIGLGKSEIAQPLQAAAESIWLYQYTQPAARGEQIAGLKPILHAIAEATVALNRMGPGAKRRLVQAYRCDVVEVGAPDALAAGYTAEATFKSDLAALDRLRHHLTVASRGTPGAPSKAVSRQAAARLIRVFEDLTGVTFSGNRQSGNNGRQFVVCALQIMGFGDDADGAISAVVRKRRSQPLAK